MNTIVGFFVCGFIIIFIIIFIVRLLRFLRDIQMAYREGVREGMRPRSYIFGWAIRREREARCSDQLKPSEHLFSAIIWGLATYWRDAAKVMSSQFEEPQSRPIEQFSSDAGLFELSCYVYIRLDLWLYQSKPSQREAIAVSLAQQLISLFSRALEMDVSGLFAERIAGYGKLLKKEEGVKECHIYLSHLIRRTEGGKLPATCDFGIVPIRLDALVNFFINSELVNFETTMILGFIKGLKNYCSLSENSMQENEWMAQEEQPQSAGK